MPASAWLKEVAPKVIIPMWMLVHPASAQDAPGQGFFTTSDQVKLHYLEAGQGETILFIPGWLMPADVWEAQFSDLSKDHHVVALDPRSQGLSDMTKSGNDPMRRSKDIRELMDHLQLNSVVLVGWSLGAFDTLAYLRQFGDDKLNALVLVDAPLAAPLGPAPVQRNPFMRRFQADRAGTDQAYVWSLFKRVQSRYFYENLTQSVDRIPTDIALMALDNTMPGDNWQPSLRALREVPLLYDFTPKYASQAAYLKEVYPQAREELFDHTGHALFADDPKRFNELLRDFLRQASLYPAGLPSSHGEFTVVSGSSPPLVSTPTVLISAPTPVATIPIVAALPPSPTFTPRPEPNLYWSAEPSPQPKVTFQGDSERSSRALSTRSELASGNPVRDGFFITSDHVKLHYLEAGKGQTLVFIPGWLLPAEIWKAQLEGLSQDYHVVALDPRSQGESDITANGDEPVRQAKDIHELLDHLQVSSVVLVGWSHGGFQVLAYMGQYGTNRLYAAVLVDSALAAASSPSTRLQDTRFLEQFRRDRPGATRNFVWGLFKKQPPKDFIHRLNEAAARTPTDIAIGLMNNAFPGERWQPSLKTLCQVPLLYAVTPKYSFQANYLTQVDPLARVEFFETAGHALFVDEPERFNDLIRDFLRGVSRYPAGLPEPKRRQSGKMVVHSYLENPQ